MADDWKPGDYALCVKRCNPVHLAWIDVGQCLRVADVHHVEVEGTDGMALGLDFVGRVHPRFCYNSNCFIKITPSADLIEAERREEVPA